jgi:hypothetical protein
VREGKHNLPFYSHEHVNCFRNQYLNIFSMKYTAAAAAAAAATMSKLSSGSLDQ